ncbi:DUF2318 domain-containing protein [archaeon]|nr:DUF2318 domain-containing protein [archaeon]
MNKKVLWGLGILVIVVTGFLFLTKNPTGNAVRAELIDEGDYVKIPLSGISKTAEFYNFKGIEFFVVESKEGLVKTAFNACDVCYRSKKGYRQEGDDMICNNCGNHYAISGLGTQNLRGGGCWPGFLRSSIDGEYLIIKKTDLENGRYRFQ